MTEIESFLANQKRYRCERMAADLTEQQCEVNRRRVTNFVNDVFDCGPCKDCAGLNKGAGVTKPVSRVCVESGCDKWKVIGDFCTKHAKARGITAPVEVSIEERRRINMDRSKKATAARLAKMGIAPKVATVGSVVPSPPPVVHTIVPVEPLDHPAMSPLSDRLIAEIVSVLTPVISSLSPARQLVTAGRMVEFIQSMGDA